MCAAVESGRKFLDLLGVVVPGVARPVRVALQEHSERSFAVNLHQPMIWKRHELPLLVMEEVGFHDQGDT